MPKVQNNPRISVNKLAQYVTSRAARQNQILRMAKFPTPFITAYYKEAGEAIAKYLAGNMKENSILDNAIATLSQKVASNVYETRRVAGNIDAIETFGTLLDDIDFDGASPKLAANTAPHLALKTVSISVRPEITLHSKSKSSDLVGGIKLHFPKTEPLDAEQAGYVSALMQGFCKDHLWKDGEASGGHCMVIDLASGKVYPGVKSVKQRMKDIENACIQIASIWPTIEQ